MTSGHCQRRHVRQKGSARIRVPLPNPCAIAESVCRYHVKATAPIVDTLVPMLTTCATTTRPAHLSRFARKTPAHLPAPLHP